MPITFSRSRLPKTVTTSQNWRIPLEIIYLILTFLFDEHSPRVVLRGPTSVPWGIQWQPATHFISQDLKSVSLTCRALADYTRPFVFRCVQLSTGRSLRPKEEWEKMPIWQWYSTVDAFVDLLRHSPQASEHVEYLFISGCELAPILIDSPYPRVAAEGLPKWRQRLATSFPSTCPSLKVKQRLEKKKMVWIEALNRRYPKLRWLVLDLGTRWHLVAPDVAQGLQRLLKAESLEGLSINPWFMTPCMPQPRKNLKYMVFGGCFLSRPDDEALRPDLVGSVGATRVPQCELPVLKLLDLSNTQPYGVTKWLEALSTRTFNLTRLERCRIPVHNGQGWVFPFYIDFLKLWGGTLVHIAIYVKWYVSEPSRPANGEYWFEFECSGLTKVSGNRF
ncbi:hypothetical protein CC2G_012121 [Coprinopsis cinerea AmutBmut pab1-1]|nr:hypothetical protein CC2G_012121 [Coprinopsis cinerea AmutBmut pab1-1]